MAPTSPTVARWELRLRLRRLRELTGIDDVDTIIEAVGISRPYWSQVDADRRMLTEDKLQRLLDLFSCDPAERAEVIALRSAAKERGWWSKYPALIKPELARLYGLEYGAESIRCYNSLLIPGLLQSERYARTIIGANALIRPFEVEQHLAVRMRRQQRLTEEDPIQLTAVFSQAALVQQTGGPDVLREQLEHLRRLIEEHPDTIEIRVIPFTATEGTALGGSTYHLLDFASPQLPTLAWSETALGGEILEDPASVSSLGFAFNQALSQTIDRAATLALIKEGLRS
ncbi:DUF5753 domain-containing protein [Nocardia sp. NPDC051030]|uniref:DUF5753 domain-containing protein n=1 Tax=Nocardia sp. NPDC051030 TaxID=3155162 RepID=UPI003436F037